MILNSTIVSHTAAMFDGDSDAINGYYCYDSSRSSSSSSCINDNDAEYTVN